MAVLAVIVLFVLQQLAGPALRDVGDVPGPASGGQAPATGDDRHPGPCRRGSPGGSSRARPGGSGPGRGVGLGHPREAVVGLFRVASIRARGVASAVLLAGFRWWLALALLSFYVALVRFLGDNCKRGVAAMRGHPQRFRRVDYIRDLALLPAAARELRIFGLAGWVATRFEGLWQTAMVDFWADRRRGRWVPPLSALGITVALDGAARAGGGGRDHRRAPVGLGHGPQPPVRRWLRPLRWGVAAGGAGPGPACCAGWGRDTGAGRADRGQSGAGRPPGMIDPSSTGPELA